MGFHGAFETELFFAPTCYCFEAPLLANLAAARPLLSPQEQTKAAPATAPEAPQATLTRNDIQDMGLGHVNPGLDERAR